MKQVKERLKETKKRINEAKSRKNQRIKLKDSLLQASIYTFKIKRTVTIMYMKSLFTFKKETTETDTYFMEDRLITSWTVSLWATK